MERTEILKEVNDLFFEIIDNNKVIIDEQTQASDIDEWDSLTHILWVLEIQKHFKIKFTTIEIQSWKNVGEMLETIQKKGI